MIDYVGYHHHHYPHHQSAVKKHQVLVFHLDRVIVNVCGEFGVSHVSSLPIRLPRGSDHSTQGLG